MPGKIAFIVEQPVDVPQNPIRTVEPGRGLLFPMHRRIERPEPETPPFTAAADLRFHPVFPCPKRQIQRINLPGTIPFAGEVDQGFPVEREFPEPVALHFGRHRSGAGRVEFEGDGCTTSEAMSAGQFPDVEPAAGIRTHTLCRTVYHNLPRRHPGNQRHLFDDRPVVFRPEFPDRPLLPQIGEGGIRRAEHPGETASAQFSPIEHLPRLIRDRTGNLLTLQRQHKSIHRIVTPVAGIVQNLSLRSKIQLPLAAEADRPPAVRLPVQRQQNRREIRRIPVPPGEGLRQNRHADAPGKLPFRRKERISTAPDSNLRLQLQRRTGGEVARHPQDQQRPDIRLNRFFDRHSVETVLPVDHLAADATEHPAVMGGIKVGVFPEILFHRHGRNRHPAEQADNGDSNNSKLHSFPLLHHGQSTASRWG